MSDLVHLRGGLVAPLAAYTLVLNLERDGITLTVDGSDIIIHGTVTADTLAQLRRWKQPIIALLQYVADDRHLFDKPQPRAPRLSEPRSA